MTRARFFFLTACAVLLATVLFPGKSFGAEPEKVVRVLQAPSLERGYTVTSPNNTMVLGILPRAVAEPVRVTLEETAEAFPDPEGWKRISSIWVIDVVRADTSIPSQQSSLRFFRPLALTLRHGNTTLFQRQLFWWDRIASRWLPLTTSSELGSPVARANLKMPFVHLAVFETSSAVEGRGSWFRHRLSDTAASNDFPMGSTLKVTDLDAKKSVQVVVRSKGPFVGGRVIDITRSAFQKLRSVREGVARVRVELFKG